ncbi:MAG: LemA family protein [Candidatus Yanofskybacteria bacterium GW2011_GWC1_48_11]|uniref:LemA family protein n=1 Tax=Candidatus Yanofskybacteria bacterium GW2011_GWC1_48_11 TaxID=1619027 RepID=A0A837IM15_9BACT|nr:MAG: LemA family protein [Candidatus Yanofskybacteria bacterium GW2011_GWC1_48_11]
MNILFPVIFVILIISGFFDVIPWSINIVALIGAVALWGVLVYNSFVTLRNRVREAFSDINVQLKRRYDLIPNLVNTVKGYATHERELLAKVTEARTRAMGAQGIHDKAVAENMLSQTLKSLFAVAENYPDLKASANFLELQRELRDTEDKIQAARRFYNTNVMSLNTSVESFPSNMIARAFAFKKEEFFELEEEAARSAPQVQF